MHVDAGAKMVPFAGYEMPIQYKDGIVKEHISTRSYAGRALSHLAPTGLSQVHTHYGFKQAIQLRIIISSYGHSL